MKPKALKVGQHVKSEFGRFADGRIEWRYGTIVGRVRGRAGWVKVKYWAYNQTFEVHVGDLRPVAL